LGSVPTTVVEVVLVGTVEVVVVVGGANGV
jgi:hypothetical protein